MSYSFHTTPSAPCVAGNCRTGEYLLVRYGNGTQLIFIQHADPDRKTMTVFRLVNRGSEHAKWRPSKLSRFDWRILGKSEPVAQDPPLAAKLTLGENKVVLPICNNCGDVHSVEENCPE